MAGLRSGFRSGGADWIPDSGHHRRLSRAQKEVNPALLSVSLAGARAKLAEMDQITARRNQTVQLDIPAFTHAAGRSGTNPIQRRRHP